MNKYNINGKNYYSVTHFTAIPDKSQALIPWAVKVALDYFMNHQDDQIDDLYEVALRAYKEKSEKAMNIGSEVHRCINKYILNGILDYGHDNIMIDNCLDAFKKFVHDFNPKWIESECVVVNEREKYAGTLDATCEIVLNHEIYDLHGKIYCIDFKTSSAIYDEYWLQVCAYVYARTSMRGEYTIETNSGTYIKIYDPVVIPNIAILRLDKETGEYDFKVKSDPAFIARQYKAFCYLVKYFFTVKNRRII